jgi:hypothetical protein
VAAIVKRKAFKTSPSVRIPRAAVEKLQQSKVQAQAQAQAQEIIRLETANAAICTALERTIDAYARRHKLLYDALQDLIAVIDMMHQRAGKRPLPLLDGKEIRWLEEIRLLSIGV